MGRMRRLWILLGVLAAAAAAAVLLVLPGADPGARRGRAGRGSAEPPEETPHPAAVEGGRCAATTRGGSRCTRPAEPGSRFCWQHG